MQARIRKAGLPDVEHLIGLFLEFNSFEETLDPEFKALDGRKAGDFKRHVEKCVKGRKEEFVLVAEKQGRIVGLIHCQEMKRPGFFRIKKTGFVKDLFVLPKCRKQGIGKLLVKEAEKEFRKRKLGYACLTVLSNNKSALKAYKAAGFKEAKKEMRKKIQG
ncbi:MAG: GNAT family N-acetyltransferase [archaeon]